MTTPAPSSPRQRFDAARHDVLTYLHDRFGFALWVVSRVEGNHWIALDCVGTGYGVEPGDVFRWSDSLCYRMLTGRGPHIAPVAQQVPAFAEAPVNDLITIGAYIGLPISGPGGELFGTLCAIDPATKPETITHELPQLQLLVRLLGDILGAELEAQERERTIELIALDEDRDHETGLTDRTGWDRFLEREETRCRRLGHAGSVILVSVDSAVALAAAERLRPAVRERDMIARLDEGLLGILAVECGTALGDQLVRRLHDVLDGAGIAATITSATRHPSSTLQRTWLLAAEPLVDTPPVRRLALPI
jgi:GAF domain-containing protein